MLFLNFVFKGRTCSRLEHFLGRKGCKEQLQFGALLRKTRKMAGLTQEEMAELMHMSRPNISKLERDEIELKAADLIRWAQATDMPQVFASVLCGIDPDTLVRFLDQVMNFAQLVGAFILPIFGSEFVYVERHQ